MHGGRIDRLEIYPNLWAGVGLVRGGAGTALVGSHEEVANLIYEYHSVGFDEFILSGYPHLEEAYWFAEGVLPLLKQQGCRLTARSGTAEVWTNGSSAARSSGLRRGSSTGSSPTDRAHGCSARSAR